MLHQIDYTIGGFSMKLNFTLHNKFLSQNKNSAIRNTQKLGTKSLWKWDFSPGQNVYTWYASANCDSDMNAESLHKA